MTAGVSLPFGRLRLERIDASGLDDASLLSDSERTRLDLMSHEKRRRQFVAGRILMQRLLATLGPASAAADPVAVSASGQPHLPHHPGLFISISHSNEWVGCAMANVPVGLDIEQADAKRSTPDLIEQVCSDTERALLKPLQPEARDSLFIELWTLKEAWLKRLGAPLDIGRMRNIDSSSSNAAAGNCLSWTTRDAISVTVLGPSVSALLADPPRLVGGARCTTRLVECG